MAIFRHGQIKHGKMQLNIVLYVYQSSSSQSSSVDSSSPSSSSSNMPFSPNFLKIVIVTTLIRFNGKNLKYFRTHDPTLKRMIYKHGAPDDRGNSSLKDQLYLKRQQVPQTHYRTRSVLNNRHPPHSLDCIKTEQTGKSQIVSPARKLSRN